MIDSSISMSKILPKKMYRDKETFNISWSMNCWATSPPVDILAAAGDLQVTSYLDQVSTPQPPDGNCAHPEEVNISPEEVLQGAVVSHTESNGLYPNNACQTWIINAEKRQVNKVYERGAPGRAQSGLGAGGGAWWPTFKSQPQIF